MRRVVSVLLCALMCLAPFAALASDYVNFYGETSIYYASAEQLNNISIAAQAINGSIIGYGQRFSFNAVVGPRTAERGYVGAVNGRGARVTGGGVSQVATTLLLAVDGSGYFAVEEYMAYDEKFTAGYVTDPSKAVVTDYNNGHDFCFTSYYPGTLQIQAWMNGYSLCVALTEYTGGATSPSSGGAVSQRVSATPMPSEWGQIQNVRLAVSRLQGCAYRYGDRFSFNGTVGPRTEQAGFTAGTNGRGVSVIGGGVAQVASNIYMAARQMDCVTIDPVRTYGDRYTGSYVTDPEDAVVTDYSAGIDFSFVYYGSRTLVLSFEEYDGWLYCYLTEY